MTNFWFARQQEEGPSVLARVREILSHVTYKPGWKIEAYRERVFQEYFRIMITVSCAAKDVTNPAGEPILLTFTSSLDQESIAAMKDEDILRYFIYKAIWQMEEHEFKEWFKFNGQHVYDPHPELKENANGKQKSIMPTLHDGS